MRTPASTNLFLFFWVAFSISLSALAQNYDQSIDCDTVDKEGGSNYEMGQCAARARQEAQCQLEQVLKQLRTLLKGGTSEKALAESQASWLAWRDKEAALCAHAQGFAP